MKRMKLNYTPTNSDHHMAEALKKVWQTAYLSLKTEADLTVKSLPQVLSRKGLGTKKTKPS
jgi:hypothetical protein